MKRLLIALLAAIFFMPAFATPAQDASIQKLLTLTDAQKLNDAAIVNSNEMIDSSLKPVLKLDNMTAERKKIVESFLEEYKQIVRDEFSWEKMLPDYIRIYKETFTEEEIQDLITFYESPTGRMFVQKMPVIMDKASTVMRQRMTAILVRMNMALNGALNTTH